MAIDLPREVLAGKPEAPSKVERAGAFYKWKDDKGRWHYSETLPQNQEFETVEVNKFGRVMRQIDLQRDPLKQKSIKDKAEREREEKQIASVRQRDDALLRTYTDEREIDDARERNVALPEQAIRGLEKRLSQTEASRADLVRQVQEREKNGDPVPAGLREDVAEENLAINRIRSDIERYRKQIIAIHERYEDDKRRFRELRGTDRDAASTAAPALQ